MSTVKKYNNRKTVQQRNAEGTTSRRKNGTMENRNVPITADFRDANDHEISRPYLLMKTGSKQSKRRDLHLK